MFIRIRKKERREYYITDGGRIASVILTPDDKATLIVKDENGCILMEQEYNSRKGALIGLGRRYGKSRFHHMVDTLETRRMH